jgi:hypothetical protein
MGFPARFSFDDLGGPREAAGPITHPRRQVGHVTFNEVHWQLAGLSKISELVSLTIAADGSRVSGGEAWNAADDPALRVALTHPSTGVYVVTAQAAYPDWSSTSYPVVFRGAVVTPHSSGDRRATYTLDSATQITVRVRDGAGTLIDCAFTVDVK